MDNGTITGIFLILIFSIVLTQSAFAFEYNTFPAVKVKTIPSPDNFLSKDRTELLGNYDHTVLTRENGEKIYVYFLHTGISSKPAIFFYFEDKTFEKLKNYIDFNSDFFLIQFKTTESGKEELFIFSEREGRGGCMIPVQYRDEFLSGSYSACEGGAVINKKTDEGWAIYVKFFESFSQPTNENPYFMQMIYGDLEKVVDNKVEELTYYTSPTNLQVYGTVFPISDVKPQEVLVNDGKIEVDDFLYKPRDVLTEGLTANYFPCADDTITVRSDQQTYDLDDVAKITVVINSEVQPITVYLKIYDASDNIVYKTTKTYSGKTDLSFLVDLDEFQKGIYLVEAEFGINGPKNEIKFGVETTNVSVPLESNCYFYLLYDSTSRQLSVLLYLNDASSTFLDQVQVFVDKDGDGGMELDSDDVTLVIDKVRFGGLEYQSDRGWLTGEKNEEPSNGRIKQTFEEYQALFNVPDVSDNFRLAIGQIDYNNLEVKTSLYPSGSFFTIPDSWSNVVFTESSSNVLIADKWLPDEILLRQSLDVNLILIGDEWNSSIQNKIKNNLESTYSPLISSEVGRAGIQYDYKYNFISVSEEASSQLFDYMKGESKVVRPFYGEEDFDAPWGLGPWIQNNHTEWINQAFQRYDIEYRLIDAEKIEDYIYENIIKSDSKLNKLSSANLIFIADDTEKIDFLHNYDLMRKDTTQKKIHHAVGLMGYGGKYNFYFFDLYAVPWHDLQGFDLFYDMSMENYAKNLHDIESEDEYATLISDYVNNSTSLIITPSYLYSPVYKKNYVIDLVITQQGRGVINVLDERYINQDKIISQLQELIPYSNWEIKVTIEDVNSRNIPKSLKEGLIPEPKFFFEDYPQFGSYDAVDSDEVKQVATEWATTKVSSRFKDFKDIEESSWVIPVILVETEGSVYIDYVGVRGISPPHPDNPEQPCCAFAFTSGDEVWNQKVSATDLVLHEVGHTLSFMHPFLGYDSEGKSFRNDYFNWYGSVMAYNSPGEFGCGFWYGLYVGEICGIADTSFTKFEKDNFSRGVVAYLVKAANSNVYRTMINLEQDGKDPNNPPVEIRNALETINSNLEQAKSAFMVNDLTSDSGAIKYAYAAALESEKLAEKYEVSYEPQIKPSKASLNIPPWIKNTAGWWASNEISEPDFINAIQYLIKQRIIVIPDLPESGEAAVQKVPGWVRNNAGWWAEGTITDKEFVTAIQFLVKEGIIRV